MLDVHPPHHAASTWRDFLIHIATIVVGLLIAIGLEQTVEAVHHRHLVHVTRENLEHEIDANEKLAAEDLRYVRTDADAMKANIEAARQMRDQPGQHGISMSFRFTWSSFASSAWTSARDSGALTYMDPAEVQRFADVYGQQEIVNAEAVKLFTDQVQVAAPMQITRPGEASRMEDLHEVMLGCARTGMRLETLGQVIEQLGDQYRKLRER